MKLTISTAEILKALGLPEGIEIEISDRNGKDWISNIGWDFYCHPESLDINAQIEVKFRNSKTQIAHAYELNPNWKETDGHPATSLLIES